MEKMKKAGNFSFEDLEEMLEYENSITRDKYVNSKELKMEGITKMNGNGLDSLELSRGDNGGISVKLSDYAWSQLFGRMKMPIRYQKRLSEINPQLVAEQFNFLSDYYGKNLMLRFKAGNPEGETHEEKDWYVRGVLSDSYTRIDNIDVFKLVGMAVNDKGLSDKVDLRSYILNDKKFQARVVFRDEHNTGRVDQTTGERDILKFGLDIENSEVGYSSIRIIPLVYRQVCSNGLRMWKRDEDMMLEQRHIHIGQDKLYDKVVATIANIFEGGKEMVEKLDKTAEIRIDNPYETIDNIVEQESLADKTKEKIVENYETYENGLNAYSIINAITRTARDEKNEKRIELEEVAGKLLDDIA